LGNAVSRIPAAQQAELDKSLAEIRAFLDEHLDPVAIDRNADIPRHLINGLAHTGVLGMTAPKEYGGRGFSQRAYCKILEEIGARCASTSVFTNAHHSIGIRALLLFGTREQKQRWLPALVSGEQLAAFALTEEEAGSDAANVQTTATPSPDDSHFILNGEKRYITNASIAQVLTVMARTPVPGSDKTSITAFLVTPDMPGFTMLEPRMEKLGIRGTATGRFAAEHGGAEGKYPGADRQRIKSGADCSISHYIRGVLHGRGEDVFELAVSHANKRRQFKRRWATSTR
jgi:alkylation response protein AidB-like acyl-CoA dehydrogenase